MPPGETTMNLNLEKLDTMLAADGGCKLLRLQEDHYMLVIPQYDPTTKKPTTPLRVDFSREGAAKVVENLERERAAAEKKIANMALLVKRFDELDAAEAG